MPRTKNVASLFEKKTKVSAVDLVIDSIKNILIQKKILPGDLLPSEQALADSLGVGRGSVREALKILDAFGIVEIIHGDGTYIATSANKKIFDPLIYSMIISNSDSNELIQLREMVEMGVINTIIDNATDEDLRKLEAVHAEYEALGQRGETDLAQLNACDLKFHRTMATLTHNHLIENMYNFVIDIFAPTINATFGLERHRKIITAIVGRDKAAAMAAEHDHTATWIASQKKL
ncbi:FadR/GntR family transcriptional regulator [Propionivibrio dicarboxylicus]|uniref:Regulatory protein, gntR family n=1 Tax=Propionivibrio dicarboxylicus TaxID=83767 RepID=A0A1G8DH77_9RHOO|nr:GntR family transcriptional regulator [Propionivibrio dicarboxylicus]SDH57025.1 regulatory protein, gntR family [Propionivibrio dicarboxylicus]